MKILFYLPPWVAQDYPDLRTGCVYFYHQFIEALLDYKDVSCFVIMGEVENRIWEKNHIDTFEKIENKKAILKFGDVYPVFKTNFDVVTKWYKGDYSDKQLDKMIEILITKLPNSYHPDIVFTFYSPNPFLKKMYSHALFFQMESGIFSQPPFPKTWYLDAFGLSDDNYINTYYADLRNLEISAKQRGLVNKIREKYIGILRKKDPLNDIELNPNNKFKKLVLLPLQVSSHMDFQKHCPFKDQIDYLYYVLENIDKDIGVVVTEHPGYPQITRSWHSFFSAHFQNYIYHPKFSKYNAVSQFFMHKIDGVITVASIVGMQALLYKIPLFVVGDHFISKFADESDISKIGDYFENGKYQDKDNVLYHLLTRYWISPDYLFDPHWLYSFFQRSLNKKKDFSFYELIDENEDKYIEHLLNKAIDDYVFERDSITALNLPLVPFLTARAEEEILRLRPRVVELELEVKRLANDFAGRNGELASLKNQFFIRIYLKLRGLAKKIIRRDEKGEWNFPYKKQ